LLHSGRSRLGARRSRFYLCGVRKLVRAR